MVRRLTTNQEIACSNPAVVIQILFFAFLLFPAKYLRKCHTPDNFMCASHGNGTVQHKVTTRVYVKAISYTCLVMKLRTDTYIGLG